jgi:hypothetical protein
VISIQAEVTGKDLEIHIEQKWSKSVINSERVGFEPTVELLTPQLLSRKPLSTTQPPLQELLLIEINNEKKYYYTLF